MHKPSPKSDPEDVEAETAIAVLGPISLANPKNVESKSEPAVPAPTHQYDPEIIGLAFSGPVLQSDPRDIGLASPAPVDKFRIDRLNSIRKPRLPASAEAPPTQAVQLESGFALSGPSHETGTVRRHTGNPQTFYDWVLTSNESTSAKRGSFPLLKSPVADIAASSTYSRATSSREGTTAPASRPDTRGSLGMSSLRDAVLGAAEPSVGGGLDDQVMESKAPMIEEPKETKKAEEKDLMAGYSGAWP
jgi:hypothetical protein